ncbi:MAG: hypothetical protein WDM79_12775 [Terricaulis sp.]
MKKYIFAAAIALAACTPPAPEAPPEPAAPASLMEQAQALSPEQGPVFAWQQLTAYQTSHPDVQPACTAVRATESRGVIPADVAPDSFYAQYAGSLVYSVQCGPQLTGTRMDPREHWLVVLAPGAAEPTIVSCHDNGLDKCPRVVPRAAAPATPEGAKQP